MNLENIKQGDVFKNYKELCIALDVLPKGGKSKMAHIRELERHFSFSQQKYQIIIEEIYSEPLDKEHRYMYQLYLQRALLSYFVKLYQSTGENEILISKGQLFLGVNMINEGYVPLRKDKEKTAEMLALPIELVQDFYSIMDSKLAGLIQTALNNLAAKSIIICNYTIITNKGVPDKRVQTLILGAEQETLEEMKCKTKTEILFSGKWYMFYDSVLSKLPKDLGIEFYYKGYQILFTDKVVNQKEVMDNFLEMDKSYNRLNDIIQEEHMKNVMNRYDKILELSMKTGGFVKNNSDARKLTYIDNYVDGNLDMLKQVIDK